MKVLLLCASLITAAVAQDLHNPLLPEGADPFVTSRDGFYYYTQTTGKNITLWKTRNLADLRTAAHKVVWSPPPGQPYSLDVWAPELHFLGEHWYVYFAADDGKNQHHRIWVLENGAADPLEGEWKLKGKLADPGDHWAIDPSVFKSRNRLFLLWSGWAGTVDGQQNIYIAELSNPWTMKSDRVLLSSPQFDWELAGDTKLAFSGERNPANQVIHVNVNEGPEMLQHDHSLFLIYSASACWTDWYELGMLQAEDGANLLDPGSWKKTERPVFWGSSSAHAFGTGHNSFFKSSDGKQDWIIYHANPETNQGCGGHRAPRAQPFTWNPDGTPNFGRPVSIDSALPRP